MGEKLYALDQQVILTT